MPVYHRTATEYKNYLIQLLVDTEVVLERVKDVAGDLAGLTDAEVATATGLTNQDSNSIKGAYASLLTAINAWNKTNQNAALGIRMR